MRKKSNHISYLRTDSVEVVSNHDEMCEIVKDYFTNVFAGTSDISDPILYNEEVTVPTSQNNTLIAVLSFEEFSLAVKQIHPDKASEPNGLNPAFFQHFLSLMGKEVFNCCENCFRSVCSQ